MGDQSLTSLADALRNWDAKVGKRFDDRAELLVTNPTNPKISHSYLIDTSRNVMLMITHVNDGKVTGTVEFSDFVELAGCWWARSVEHKNADGKTHTRIRRTLTARGKKAFLTALKKALVPRKGVIFIHKGLPAVDDAKQAAVDGKASFESAFTMCNHFALSQQWERSNEHFEAMRKLQGSKRGMAISTSDSTS